MTHQISDAAGHPYIMVAEVPPRPWVPLLRQKPPGTGVVILGGSRDSKAALFVTVTKDLARKVSAEAVIKAVQGVFEAKGGGRPESASAGGGTPARLADAVAAARAVVRERLNGGG